LKIQYFMVYVGCRARPAPIGTTSTKIDFLVLDGVHAISEIDICEIGSCGITDFKF
jgi:hypothetical protein